mmetsp:Transcript_5968/g.15870  ORF Transcript_5968/g.15870 Transcript_5968/m.15870 type:complete len:112 (-) Transcript_5968:1169-1504(-)|eukprot:1159986-Pelagomonas_calceolata.AAC.2
MASMNALVLTPYLLSHCATHRSTTCFKFPAAWYGHRRCETRQAHGGYEIACMQARQQWTKVCTWNPMLTLASDAARARKRVHTDTDTHTHTHTQRAWPGLLNCFKSCLRTE